MERWYSEGLNAEKAKELMALKAEIRSARFGLQEYEGIAEYDRKTGLHLDLLLILENGNGVNYITTSLDELNFILAASGEYYVDDLVGKKITAHLNEGLSALEGISILPKLLIS